MRAAANAGEPVQAHMPGLVPAINRYAIAPGGDGDFPNARCRAVGPVVHVQVEPVVEIAAPALLRSAFANGVGRMARDLPFPRLLVPVAIEIGPGSLERSLAVVGQRLVTTIGQGRRPPP